MDPVAHTLAGASLARAGLHRVTPLATATLVVGANAPDIDIFASLAGSYASLALRRGWTHGPLALVLLPCIVAGCILAWDRWVRRRRDPGATPARPLGVLLLAFLGAASHIPLDWLNTYGIRFLMPFSERWFYGDSVFIVDPWIWLVLGGGLAVAGRRTVGSDLAWGAFAVVLSVPVFLAPQVPPVARWVWCGGVALVVVLRGMTSRPRAGAAGDRQGGTVQATGVTPVPAEVGAGGSRVRDRPALVGTLTGLAYILLMVAVSGAGRQVGAAAAREEGVPDVEEILYSPLPANPFAASLVVVTSTEYRYGALRWLPSGGEARVQLDAHRIVPRGDWSDPAVVRALTHPDLQNYMVWARFPWVRTESIQEGVAVTVGDARYSSDEVAGGLAGVRVVVPR